MTFSKRAAQQAIDSEPVTFIYPSVIDSTEGGTAVLVQIACLKILLSNSKPWRVHRSRIHSWFPEYPNSSSSTSSSSSSSLPSYAATEKSSSSSYSTDFGLGVSQPSGYIGRAQMAMLMYQSLPQATPMEPTQEEPTPQEEPPPQEPEPEGEPCEPESDLQVMD